MSPRDRALAQWRRVHLAPQERAQEVKARSSADLLPRILTDLHLDRRRTEAEVLRVWNHLIDPQITAHAQPVGLRNGTLFVTVDSNVWLSEIVRYRRPEILQRLQSAFGGDLIRKISFRTG